MFNRLFPFILLSLLRIGSSQIANPLCDIISATNVVDIYTEWICDTASVPESNSCLWSGVHCINNTVIIIDLAEISLAGTLPLNIGNFSYLKSLLLFNNSLTGTIPSTLDY